MSYVIIGRELRLASARKTVTVDIPELECAVILKELSIAQLGNLDNDTVKQLAMMIVDEQGNRIYTSEEDLANLAELSASVSTRLLVAAAKLNGISQSAVDESVKNLLAGPSTGSVSD
jgi:hypothetical protein